MSQTILVVEDTELLRRMYSDKLVQEGFRVLPASDGLEALSLLRAETPDLILLDLIMPKMSGLEVIEVVKKDPRLKDIPVLILSNLGQDADMQRGIELGAVDYMIKNDSRPADVAEKIKLVLSHMAGRGGNQSSYRMFVRDREADSDRLVTDAHLTRRFWCPACEVELNLELIAKPDHPGWYDAHFVCPHCSREY
jgi:DNA-binding response OmpR family regulator